MTTLVSHGKSGRTNHAETRLAELETFKSENRHCNVKQTAGKLGTWVTNVRHSQKKGNLSEELKYALDNMGFKWLV